MKKVNIGELNEFDHERFNGHYRNLIDIGMSSGMQEDILDTLSFLTDTERLIENIKEDMAAEPNECPLCKEKDLHIKEKDLHIQELKSLIKILEELKAKKSEIIDEQRRQIEAL